MAVNKIHNAHGPDPNASDSGRSNKGGISFASATPDRRPRRKSMARRSGQVGYEEVKRGWFHVRFRMDVPGQEKRAYLSKPICPISGLGFLTKPERFRQRKQIIAARGAETGTQLNK